LPALLNQKPKASVNRRRVSGRANFEQKVNSLDPIRAFDAFDHQVQAQELNLLAIQLEDIVMNIADDITSLLTHAQCSHTCFSQLRDVYSS
jgi:hypothetical protein